MLVDIGGARTRNFEFGFESLAHRAMYRRVGNLEPTDLFQPLLNRTVTGKALSLR